MCIYDFSSEAKLAEVGRSVCGTFTMLFFLGSVWGVSELLYSQAGIGFTADGFLDHSTRMACGFVPWSKVERISINSNGGHCYAIFKFHDPWDVISHSPGPISRIANTLYQYNFKTPIQINMNGFQMKAQDVLSLFYATYGEENIGFDEF